MVLCSKPSLWHAKKAGLAHQKRSCSANSFLQGLKSPVNTMLKGETLQYNPATNSFFSLKSVTYGNGTVIEPDLQVKAGAAGNPTISIMGISAVLFPADLSSLVDPTARGRYVYGTDKPPPAPPANANSKAAP